VDPLKEKKYQIEQELVRIILGEIESEKLSFDQSKEITEYSVPKLKSITSEDDLLKFITELSTKWPLFTPLVTFEQGKAKEEQKDVVTDNIMDLVDSGNINEAVDLAKTANE